jgi:hypothetical protein
MSKQSTSRLTRSRKTRRRAARPNLDRLDALNQHCWQLGTLAELLQACGQPLEPATMEGIGHAIHRDVAAMQALLAEFGKGAR